MARKERTVEDLIAELDGQSSAGGVPPIRKLPGGKARPTDAATPGFGGRFIVAVALLALGFVAGWSGAALRPPSQAATVMKPGKETRQVLLAAGWQESDQGVFTRRCQDNCRMPVLYGGGVLDVMEVNCLDRPCGEIRADFAVLDGRGQVIGQIMERRSGRQGERLQLLLESDLPEARRFLLQSFSAKARLD